jgi:putative peptide zinc metalloprotease protein
VFVVAVTAVYGLTRFEPLLVVIVLQHLAVLEQFLPSVRLDGYYVVSDLVGVPDLFAHIKPVLSGLSRRVGGGVADLKPAARATVLPGWGSPVPCSPARWSSSPSACRT